MQDGDGNVFRRHELQLSQVSWVVPAEGHVTFEKANGQMQVEEDKREEDLSPAKSVIDGLLAVGADAEDDCNLQDIPDSCAIDDRSSLCGNFRQYEKKGRLYGLDEPFISGGVFCTALNGLHNVSKHCEAFVRLAEAQA